MIKLDLPVYEITLPVSQKTISFSPLIVKEEKNIGAAKQTGGNKASFKTFLEILKTKLNCEVFDLCETDLISCIIEIRKYSIGEKFKTSFICPFSKEKITKEIDCNEMSIKGTKSSSTIKEMGHTVKLQMPQRQDELWTSIKFIETVKEKIDFDELNTTQKKCIFDSLPIKIKDKIENEIEDLLHYEYELKYSPNGEHDIKIKSAEDFFTLLFVM